ncbi:unnamed protein product [Rhizoctonia solani]|uniref:F-box domain-containing protein n=1 Tax=Rhizoctonia solani TaxID=456999 RepID=A0A8H3D7E9_9AGAM|nr:unnamed protein product [Rhizoctonia solani]CAE6513863.1 unnamed protein product [Rhizoctonia solani]
MVGDHTSAIGAKVFPSEILITILEHSVSSLLPFNPTNRRVLASLCRLSWEGYEVATTHLYHTVIITEDCPHTGQLAQFLRSVAKNPYLAQKVVNLWVGDLELNASSSSDTIDQKDTELSQLPLNFPDLPRLQRFAINGQRSSVSWGHITPSHLTVSDLKCLDRPIPTLRTLHLINSLLCVNALESALKGCPLLHNVIFELTEAYSERLDFMTLMQLGIVILKNVPRLRKLTFRIENFWMLHHTTRMLPERLEEEGLRDSLKGKIIATVWSWELGVDFCNIWVANSHKQRVGKEHKICY